MFKEEYQAAFRQVIASEDTYEKVMQMTKKKKSRTPSRTITKVLLAAVLILGLAITASASESIQNWFVSLFDRYSETGLSGSQIQYVEENTQTIPAESQPLQHEKNTGKTRWIQFVEEDIIIQLDIHNSALEGGEPEYTDYRLRSLLLSETEAKIRYVYMGNPTPEELNQEQYTRIASIPEMTVVMKNGENAVLKLTSADRAAMNFTAQQPLELEAVDHILLPDGTRLTAKMDRYRDCNVTLDSCLNDGQMLYVTMNVTLPESIESIGEGWVMENPHFRNIWFYPADHEKASMEQIMANQIGMRTVDDGDGDDRTFQLILDLSFWDDSMAFTPGSTWKLHLGELEVVWKNEENERYLYDEKYAGQDVLLDGEEAQMITRWEIISYDTFEFLLSLEEKTEKVEYELVKEPITFTGTRAATIEELMENPQVVDIGPVEAQLVSFKISPLTYFIAYSAKDPLNANAFNPGTFTLVMKNGKETKLFPYAGRQSLLEPVVLEEAAYVLCPDGTKLMIPAV